MGLTIAIIGRPNVGKSTLFNRLVGRQLALVHETPGVTRDRRSAEAQLSDLRFTVIDTAGLEEMPPESLEGRMRSQTERALGDAQLVFFVIDGRAGVTPADRHFAAWLRGADKPVILVVNKCEGKSAELILYEGHALGFGEPVAISAAHGEGMADLYQAIAKYARGDETAPQLDDEEVAEAEDQTRPIHLAIVGRPNVGKSTLINRLLKEERVLTGPEPGITRDSVAVPWVYRGRAIELVDTAGLRRRAKIFDALEKMSAAESLRVIRMAEVVILVVDTQAIFEQQDLAIARLVAEEGRAMVIALNKWDIAADRDAAARRLRDALDASLQQVRGIPWVAISALTGENIAALMPAVLGAYETWNRRISTSALNRWLERAIERHPPPAPQGKALHIRYATQVKARPPSFVLFMNKPELLPETYLRYLANGLREEFGLDGVPLRLLPRGGRNPFATKDGPSGKRSRPSAKKDRPAPKKARPLPKKNRSLPKKAGPSGKTGPSGKRGKTFGKKAGASDKRTRRR